MKLVNINTLVCESFLSALKTTKKNLENFLLWNANVC